MLTLEKVSKNYVSKSKVKVAALKQVSLNFPDKGMVFILGKSGCGKSTLLNIIGGIDKPTSGEIFYNGESFKDFQRADYEKYRNSVIGFVFQEFNLLKDLTVKENIALALQISKDGNIDEKIISALHSVELNENHLHRKIDELSGGEKQRVAMARAIVKKSKIILADEPTGNLDSETGKGVWQILKNLSKTQLVIVVTHDEESAYNYADRIVKICDGEITSDETFNKDLPYTDNTAENDVSIRKSARIKLSDSICFKIGVRNLSRRKVKTISIVVLSIVTIFCILLAQLTLTYSTEKMVARFIKENDVDYFQIEQGTDNNGNLQQAGCFQIKTQSYVVKNSDYILNNHVEGKQDLLDFGLTFEGRVLDLYDNNCFYITDIGLNKLYELSSTDREYSVVTEGGGLVKIEQSSHSPDFLIGKSIVKEDPTAEQGYYGKPYILAGIVDTSTLSAVGKNALPMYFCRSDFNLKKVDNSFLCNDKNFSEVSLNLGSNSVADKFKFTSEFGYPDAVLTTKERWKKSDYKDLFLSTKYEFNLKDDEIMLPYDLCTKLFEMKSQAYYTEQEFKDVELPEFLDKYYDLSFSDCQTGEEFLNVGKVKIVGVIFTGTSSYECVGSEKLLADIAVCLKTARRILIRTDSIENLTEFLLTFRKDYSGKITNIGGSEEDGNYMSGQYDFELQTIFMYGIIMPIAAAIFSFILFLTTINLISFNILQRKRESGILAALGMSNGDVSKTFLSEVFIIAAITFIVDLVLMLIAPIRLNVSLSKKYILVMPYFATNGWMFLTLFLASFVFLTLAALIPLRKVLKMKPVDAIRGL